MQIKYLLLITYLLTVNKYVTVKKSDQCDDCTQFKSYMDCVQFGCIWTDKTATTPGSCAKTTTIPPQPPPQPSPQPPQPPASSSPSYCQTIEIEQCSKTVGCALIQGKCTHFTGCSAYVMTTHSDCQGISNMCITDGVTCTNILECVVYTKEQCETTPIIKSPFKCKLDGERCRDYKCSEADTSLTTDTECSQWLSGCKTTGAGCIDVIPPCASYQGTQETCKNMRGSDGNCEYNFYCNNCRVRVCTDANVSFNTDQDCARQQTGCVTTGKGCIATLGSCSSYDGNATTCIGYIGTDGQCAGDRNGTKCRVRKCDQKTAVTDDECNKWKSGCISNGRSCVDALDLCNTYDGTITTCTGLKGSDGNCKGISITAKCSVKDCVDDSNETFTTQAQCSAIQTFCKTTGKGCVAKLQNCSSYTYTDDGTSCNSLYGLDGRCKQAASGNNCAARVCTEAPSSFTTNKQCDEYKGDCITTGEGCTAKMVCQDIVKQIICQGINNCGWNQICVSNTSCGQLFTKSICENVRIQNKPCKWEEFACRDARCNDFIGTDDYTCNQLLEGCVTNKINCVDGTNCATQFKGSKQTCLAYKAKCTNDANATETTACKPRTCDDPYLNQKNDKGCDNYLRGCVTKGEGCIINTAPCKSYSGTPDQCDKFKGNQTVRCWNTSPTGACVDKLCTQAINMKDDSTCESFLIGCSYNGNGSCILSSAPCTDYTGDQITCKKFKGNNRTNLCMAGSAGKCRAIDCNDDTTSQTDSDCNTFLSGCVTKGIGCIAKTAECGSYKGTTQKCLKFSGNLGADKCTRLEACISKKTDCASKTGVKNNLDCLLYHNDCRLKYGDTVCMQHLSNCTEYKLNNSDNDKKQAYCNSITTQSGVLCSYNTEITGTCQVRACNLWISTLNKISCENYNGQASCKLNDTYCYAPQNSCGSYTIPSNLTNAVDKLRWCNGMFTNSVTPTKCSYEASSSTVCSDINTCEEILFPLSTVDCNFQLNDGKCQFANNQCITTQTACTGYKLTEIKTQDTFCSALKSDNSGTVKQCAYIPTTSSANCVDAVSTPSPPTIPASPSAITILACSAIQSPTSQADCNLGTGSCKYYSGSCYTRVVCANYRFPVSANDADKKQLFCQNMYDNTVNEYCSYDALANSNAGGCATGKSCTGYTSVAGGNNTGKRLTCSKLRDITGTAYAFVDGAADCSAPTTATSCTIVTSGITVDGDCDLRTILGCKKHATNASCIARAACTIATVATDNDAKINECQTNPGPDSKYCTYPGSGNCVVAQALCSGYTGVTADNGLTTCQKKVNQKGKRCSWSTGTNCEDAVEICFNISGLQITDKLTHCQARIDQVGVCCSWNYGTACISAPKTCAEWNSLPTSGQLEFCQARIRSNREKCSWSAGTTCQNLPSTCNGWNNLPSQGQLTFCQTRTKLDGAKCSWVINATSCSDPPSACNGWNILPNNGKLEFCQARMKLDGGKCSWTTGTTSCRNYSCEDTLSPQSQVDCNLTGIGCTYQPKIRICYIKQAACTSYSLPETLILLAHQQSYCNNLINTTSAKCTFITGTKCAVVNICKNYNVSSLLDIEVKLATCQQAIPTSGSCTYFSGNTCIALDACKTYIGGTASSIVSDCAKQIDTNGKLCFGTGTGCISATCENVIGANSIEYCDKYVTGCVYYNNKCYTALSTCAYATGGSNAIQFCNEIKNTAGDFCTANFNTDTTCKQRGCNDDATFGFQTHSECKTYSSLCKSSGQGCIVASTTCANQIGFDSFCNWALDTDNKSTCAKGTLATTDAHCTKLTCGLNVTATTDSDCQQFHPNCLNKGQGCINQSEPCSSYYGTKAQCQLFTGNGKKCFGDSATTKTACRDKKCTDMTTVLDYSDCENLLSGCIFNGVGCVSIAADCLSYMGTQETCKEFKEIYGTQHCWGSSSTKIDNCTDRKCSDKAGTTDQECQDFLPPIAPSTTQKCITNGTVCVDIGKPCSFFEGNAETCSQFTATDGPCQPSVISAKKVSCKPRVCYEAPNTYRTDDQCQQYHPSCRTTGRGCKINISCDDYISSTLCTENKQCQLARQCRSLVTKCDQLTDQGLSVCVNTPLQNGNRCAGFTSANDAIGCRDFTCADYEESITTHNDCFQRDKTCTTSGVGCVTIGECSSYTSKSICEAANTTELSKRCTWDSTNELCRQRQCADGEFATNELCFTFLAGCQTTGKMCMGPDFVCNVFTGNPQYCLKNGSGYPCLYVNGVCYEYSKCTDITNPSFDFCQAFSTQCVPSIKTCRAVTQCEKYEDIDSCLIGVNNTKCQWLSQGIQGICKQSIICSDAINTSLEKCKAVGTKCSWDGTKCINKGLCSDYLNQITCSADTESLCHWTETSCKSRECIDYSVRTDFECLNYKVMSGLCTTDGTECVARAPCSSYQTEAACTIDPDGNPCAWNFIISGTQPCRFKQCSDIKGMTNNACIGQIPKNECVSNGVNCVNKDKCAHYKNKLSCKAGGLDGKCAFTPAPTVTDQNYGLCQLFTSCENANSDEDACKSKPKACKWTNTTNGTSTKTKCSEMDCQGIAIGTICNPIPSFDETYYTICVLSNNVCIAGDPSTISQDICYTSTFFSFTWDEAKYKCVKCKLFTKNEMYNPNPNTNTDTNNGYILGGITISLIIFGIFA
ncbi:unnamed protein product [Paramecium sonneborni]|uniref:Uncharacterized protein n=1 Tax=Paramecium sonneborni TaxID=65129 RepID=A0A8S1R5R9_9CILI|nr:unnamed protein product [Paramecium sonneborni]